MPSSRQVYPDVPRAVSITRIPSPTSSRAIEHTIIPSARLPSIDISRSVRSILLSLKASRQWYDFMSKTRVLVFIWFNIAHAVNFVVITKRVSALRWLTVPNTIIGVYGVLAQVSLMRVDIIRLLLQTYELWFVLTVNLFSGILLALYLRDLRVLTTFGMWMGYQATIMVDPSIASQLEFLWGITAPVVSTSALICYVALDVMEDDQLSDY